MYKNLRTFLCIALSLLLTSCTTKQTKFYQSNYTRSQYQQQPGGSKEDAIKASTPQLTHVTRHKKQSSFIPLVHPHPELKAPTKSIKDMTFKEASAAKAYHQHMKNTDMMIKCAQRMLAVGGDPEEMRKTRLELSELFLEKDNYKEAERYALEYQKHYPGSSEALVAGYTAIKSNFLSKLSSDRDQTKTEATIKLSQAFLEQYPQNTEYTQSVKDMMEVCYKDLLTSEVHVIKSQLNKYKITKNEGTLTGAYKRIAYVKDKLLPYVQYETPRILELELTLAQATGKQEIIKAKEEELRTKFPEQSTLLAQGSKKWWQLF